MLWSKMQKLMVEKEMSVYELAKRTGIRDTTLYNYKKGVKPSFENMCKIADALKVSLDYFRD